MARREGRGSRTREAFGARARAVDTTIDAALRAFGAPRVAWRAPGEAAVVGCEATAAVTATGSERFDAVRDAATTLFSEHAYDGPTVARPRLLGGFGFDGESTGAPWAGFPGAYFLLPRVQVTRSEGRTWLTVTGRGEDGAPGALDDALDAAETRLQDVTDERGAPPGVGETRQVPSREVWESGVRDALERIRDGDLRKVVLAGALEATLDGPFDLADALGRLGDAYGGCYRFGVDPGAGATFFGATPELLVDRAGEAVQTTALAGSAKRGDTPAADDRLAATLADSEKSRREHDLVVEAVRDQLAPFVDRISVEDRRVRKLATVQHLETPIAGELSGATHVLDLVAALHPTPAVGGLPPAVAWSVIRETEAFDRGWYAAPVGWVDADGDGTFAVGIRSAVVAGGEATLYAGNGIVADSDPGDEWAELQLKYRPVLDHLR